MLEALFRVLRRQFLGALALVLVVVGVADAATGGNFILGSLNTANSPSIDRPPSKCGHGLTDRLAAADLL